MTNYTRAALLLAMASLYLLGGDSAFAAAALGGKAAVASGEQIGSMHQRMTAIDLAQLVQGLVIVMLAIYTFISNRHQATQDKVDAIETRLLDKQEAHSERISSLEQGIRSLATQRDLTAMSANVAGVSAQMASLLEAQKVMREHMESSLRPLARMQDMLTQQQLDYGLTKTARRRTPAK